MDLEDLYREVILDHNQNPRHRGRLAEATHSRGLFNPTCGDRIAVDLKVVDGRIVEVGFDGHGCSISMASASMLAEAVLGAPVDEARSIAAAFIAFITGQVETPPPGDWESLAGVRRFPSRVKCATLAHNALMEALAAETADRIDAETPSPH
jgi:nitrogen fixation NifU-like protein